MQETKARTLYVMKILLERTDEEHMLNASELIRILNQEYGISADRRTIYGEVTILQNYGLDIVQQTGRNSGYYVSSRTFELPEVKLLVDAVQASRFITEKKSQDLVRKLKTLCSGAQGDMISHQALINSRPKTENETIYYNVDDIHTATFRNFQIAFHYLSWNMRRELVERHEGKIYHVSPWALTWDDENYYLIGYDEDSCKIKHFRVDKMRQMRIIEKPRNGEADFKALNIEGFSRKTFGMFGGEDVEVRLRCDESLAGVVIDRFGHDVWMVPRADHTFMARVVVSLSPQFYGWLTGIGDKMVIEGPERVKTEYQDYLRKILSHYEGITKHREK